ncbi:MAG: caspase family protein [Ectothiorhodospiraceae bacterium]|nr:caspase family protein [Ectothiorhodospiraceae bacterium]
MRITSKTLLSLSLLAMLLPSAFSTAASRGINLEPVAKAPVPAFVTGRYRALVVGNDEYRDPEKRWPSLQTAVAGARAIAEILKNRYGFDDVQLLENATRREMLIALDELGRDVLPNDNVLVYYAGHGFLDSDTGKGYWVPVDAVGTDQTTFLRNSSIRDELNTIAARGRHTLLIADSCFSGSLLRSGTRALPPQGDSARYYQKVAQKKSVQIMAAGGVEYVDDNYRSTGHSPFTHFLLNELKFSDKPLLTVSELSQNVEKAVANNVSQIPETGVLQGAGDELGEFIFINVEISGIPADRIKVKVKVVPEKSSSSTMKQAVATKTSPAADSEPAAPLMPATTPELLPMPTL